ncbi:MAG: CsbD family protein [Acidimicrobiales bacterium]
MSGEKDKIKGSLKKAAGEITDDEELENEGRADKAAGSVKDAVGVVKDKVDDTVDAVKKKLS